MFAIISAGIAPGLALLCYFYLKDRYEAEPITMVMRTFVFGALLVFPIMFIQYAFTTEGLLQSDLTKAFVLSGTLEEFFKWFILYYTVFQQEYFDEKYDGIVYGVAVSLGFASVENILYLLANGIEFAFTRALLPVSSHALIGVVMGFYLGTAKFSEGKQKKLWIVTSLITAIFLHGTYDYIIYKVGKYWVYAIIPFMIYLWINALRKVKLANHYDGAKVIALNDNKKVSSK